MKILIVGPHLTTLTGTELYVRDLALALAARGERPIVYSPDLGPAYRELGGGAIEVVDRLSDTDETPDVIYAHGPIATLAALLRFPATPAVAVCHGGRPWAETEPPLLPRVRRYVAVDLLCKERLTQRRAVAADRIEVIRNGVDLARFRPRGSPLPARPERALLFSNYANASTHLATVLAACKKAGIDLDVIGSGSGNPCATPENELPKYDIVFAKGRCALEALAVGAAVVPCDREGVAEMVSSRNVEHLHEWNFGFGTFERPNSIDTLLGEIDRYDPADAAEASGYVRRAASLSGMVESLVDLFGRVVRESADQPVSAGEEARALAAYTEWLAPHFASYQELRWIRNSPLLRVRRAMRKHPRIDRLISRLGRRIGRMTNE